MRSSAAYIVFALVLGGSAAQAATCVLSTQRSACPDKEKEALSLYEGKNPTEDKLELTKPDDCLKEAEKSSKIVGRGVLAKKVVSATFDGKPIGTKEYSRSCK